MHEKQQMWPQKLSTQIVSGSSKQTGQRSDMLEVRPIFFFFFFGCNGEPAGEDDKNFQRPPSAECVRFSGKGHADSNKQKKMSFQMVLLIILGVTVGCVCLVLCCMELGNRSNARPSSQSKMAFDPMASKLKLNDFVDV